MKLGKSDLIKIWETKSSRETALAKFQKFPRDLSVFLREEFLSDCFIICYVSITAWEEEIQ